MRKNKLKQNLIAWAVQLELNAFKSVPLSLDKPQLVRAITYKHPDRVSKLYWDREAIKPQYFEMVFNVDEVNEKIDQYREESGLEDAEETPSWIVYSVYHGDLIILLKEVLIPLEQEWFFGIDSHYFNYETGDVITLPLQIQTPKMSWREFRFGSTQHVDRGAGVKTRWQGIGKEIDNFMESDAPEGYKRIRSDAKVSVMTGFCNADCKAEFNFIKKIIADGGLDALREFNEDMDRFYAEQKSREGTNHE